MDISFLISSLAIGNLMSLKLQLCSPTILGIIIWLEKKILKSICNEEKVHSLTRAFNFNLGCVTECSNHYFFFPPIFSNDIATIATKFFSPISTMALPQTNCNRFFFSYFSNAIATNPFHKIFFLRNDMCTQFLQQILSDKLLLLD